MNSFVVKENLRYYFFFNILEILKILVEELIFYSGELISPSNVRSCK